MMGRTLCFLWLVFTPMLVFTPLLAWADPPSDPQDVCALMAGEQVPAGLSVLDSAGAPFDLSAALQSRPTLLIFYRGGW